jgi:hypothetical protein
MPLEVRTKGREQERGSMKDVKRKIVKNIWTEEGKKSIEQDLGRQNTKKKK